MPETIVEVLHDLQSRNGSGAQRSLDAEDIRRLLMTYEIRRKLCSLESKAVNVIAVQVVNDTGLCKKLADYIDNPLNCSKPKNIDIAEGLLLCHSKGSTLWDYINLDREEHMKIRSDATLENAYLADIPLHDVRRGTPRKYEQFFRNVGAAYRRNLLSRPLQDFLGEFFAFAELDESSKSANHGLERTEYLTQRHQEMLGKRAYLSPSQFITKLANVMSSGTNKSRVEDLTSLAWADRRDGVWKSGWFPKFLINRTNDPPPLCRLMAGGTTTENESVSAGEHTLRCELARYVSRSTFAELRGNNSPLDRWNGPHSDLCEKHGLGCPRGSNAGAVKPRCAQFWRFPEFSEAVLRDVKDER